MWLCRILKAFKQIYRNTAADSQRAQTCWLHTPWSEKLDSSSNLKIKAFCCTAWRKWNLKVSFLSGCSPKQTASGDAGAAGHHKHYRRLGPRDEERARGNNKAWQSESLQRGAAEKCPSTDNSRKTQFAPVFGVIVLKRKTTSWISTVSSRKRGIGRTNVDRKWSGRWVTDERSHCCDVTQTWHQRQNLSPARVRPASPVGARRGVSSAAARWRSIGGLHRTSDGAQKPALCASHALDIHRHLKASQTNPSPSLSISGWCRWPCCEQSKVGDVISSRLFGAP